MPAKPVAPATQPATSSQVLSLEVDGQSVTPSALFGWSATESTGSAAASFRLYDGTDSSGTPLTPKIPLTTGANSTEWFADQTVEIASGSVYLDVLSGSVEFIGYLG